MSKILIGKTHDNKKEIFLDLPIANRHGLISGATGTGKTATLQALAQALSNNGVSVFTADIKGDLSGISQTGTNERITDRYKLLNVEYKSEAAKCIFYDLYGTAGHPIRASISEMGPLLFSRLLDLNEVQTGVIQIAFRVADDNKLLIIDLKDFRAVLNFVVDQADEIQTKYGNVAKASVGAIQRKLLELENAGANHFFGEPSFDFNDLMRNSEGKGLISVLDATKLVLDPRLYSTFLLWILSELFENLPEVGDLAQPKLVFFFDEAHLLFNSASDELLEKIELVVRLIRSKGVGVYFVTQSPTDIPDKVLQQLGNRIQHALRGLTPQQQKLIRSVAESYVTNPEFNTADEISNLGIGEALVSTLSLSGEPSIVEKTLILPPESRLGSITSEERNNIISKSPVKGKYEDSIDRKSAFESLSKKIEAKEEEEEQEAEKQPKSNGRERQSMVEAFLKSILRTAGSQMGRSIMRGVLGSIFKK